MRGCPTRSQLLRAPMAFGLFGKRVPKAAEPVVESRNSTAIAAAAPAIEPVSTESDSEKASLELVQKELADMMRQLEREATTVAGGAEEKAATLSTIRQRTDPLTGQTSPAQTTAKTFSQVADKFTQ